ncbi:hypothetical protein [Actinokineospora inagensis]|uniref:hypothetical protein n=1 Tax=Actinokineospora inagensis TaxID=103730 RepID=UPI000414A4F6|nr:hypothetical protein [Actinokineospora inagensis]
MADSPDSYGRHVVNRIDGDVRGSAVQIGFLDIGAHYHAAPRAPAEWPHQVGVIPPRALAFQHRPEVDRLRAAPGGTRLLTGTGGVGKTQLAADHARNLWAQGELDVLVWISASSRQAIVAGYAQAGLEVLAADPDQAARAFLAWLEPKAGQRPCRWLVVLDDLADPADLRGLWPPNSPHGRTVVTTRRRDAALLGAGRHVLPVGLFTPWDAAAYLGSVLAAHDRREPVDQVDGLAADLAYLPLGLAQAAAYLVDAGLGCADYRRLLADRIRKLAHLLPEPGALPDDQVATVAATWSLSIERADLLRPVGLARPVLELAAMLDSNGIPQAVFTGLAVNRYLRRRAGDDDAVGALRVLHRLSLIDHHPDTPLRAVRVHHLIQRATRDALDQRDELAVTAGKALDWDWPDDPSRDAAQIQIANIDALVAHGEDALWDGERRQVFVMKGRELGALGLFAAAERHFHQLAAASHRRLGPDHHDTLAARSYHAEWRGRAGDPAGAAAELADILVDRERVQGRAIDSIEVRTAHSHLAHWQGQAGDPAGAVATIAEVVAAQRAGALRTLTDTAIREFFTLSRRLASWRGAAGDPARAVADLTAILAEYPRARQGFVDTVRHPRAHWRGVSGDPTGAMVELAELLAEQERALGPDHLEVLVLRHHHAHWRGVTGDPTGAAAELAGVLADRDRLLGPTHSHTRMTRAHLSYWHDAATHPAEAAPSTRLLPELQQTLSP